MQLTWSASKVIKQVRTMIRVGLLVSIINQSDDDSRTHLYYIFTCLRSTTLPAYHASILRYFFTTSFLICMIHITTQALDSISASGRKHLTLITGSRRADKSMCTSSTRNNRRTGHVRPVSCLPLLVDCVCAGSSSSAFTQTKSVSMQNYSTPCTLLVASRTGNQLQPFHAAARHLCLPSLIFRRLLVFLLFLLLLQQQHARAGTKQSTDCSEMS